MSNLIIPTYKQPLTVIEANYIQIFLQYWWDSLFARLLISSARAHGNKDYYFFCSVCFNFSGNWDQYLHHVEQACDWRKQRIPNIIINKWNSSKMQTARSQRNGRMHEVEKKIKALNNGQPLVNKQPSQQQEQPNRLKKRHIHMDLTERSSSPIVHEPPTTTHDHLHQNTNTNRNRNRNISIRQATRNVIRDKNQMPVQISPSPSGSGYNMSGEYLPNLDSKYVHVQI